MNFLKNLKWNCQDNLILMLISFLGTVTILAFNLLFKPKISHHFMLQFWLYLLATALAAGVCLGTIFIAHRKIIRNRYRLLPIPVWQLFLGEGLTIAIMTILQIVIWIFVNTQIDFLGAAVSPKSIIPFVTRMIEVIPYSFAILSIDLLAKLISQFLPKSISRISYIITGTIMLITYVLGINWVIDKLPFTISVPDTTTFDEVKYWLCTVFPLIIGSLILSIIAVISTESRLETE